MMKRQLWTIIVLLVVGCTPSDPELTRESVDQLKAQNRKLSKAITDLRVDISERESFLANYTRRMAEILDQVSSIEKDELRIRDLSSDLSRTPDEERDWVSEIETEIDHIESSLIESERRAEEIRNELSSQRELNEEIRVLLDNQKAIVAQQNNKLDRLRGELKDLKQGFVMLEEENAGLGIQVRLGESRIASLHQKVSELKEKLVVYVLAGSAEDLRRFRKNDVLKSRLGRLEPHPAGIKDGRFKSSFQVINPEYKTLTVPGNMKELRLRSIHGKHVDLFSVKAVEDGMQVSINNPDAFWSLSRFLILEAR